MVGVGDDSAKLKRLGCRLIECDHHPEFLGVPEPAWLFRLWGTNAAQGQDRKLVHPLIDAAAGGAVVAIQGMGQPPHSILIERMSSLFVHREGGQHRET
ncbi:Hypothetical protein AJAP_06925 [Amycolatopsis japonica]|uniref:Uncharacterized protein n=1 Tax=Amycolatopsis japonica TaxID=208439 RepID=A0A075UJQ3_9PSEU|nr:Hypothetical protein AJAP_06925 [Amycolatopsis japonica]